MSAVCALPTDEIYEKYLQKAIVEINELGDEVARAGGGARVPIVGPKLLVAMGERAVAFLNSIEFPLADELDAEAAGLQRLTPTIDALVVPDIDASLDEQAAKTSFWNAFKALGSWWA